MAGKVMFLRSNQGGRLDGNESVADSFRSDLVGFKSWSGRIIGAFTPSYVCQKNPPVGKRTRYPSCSLPVPASPDHLLDCCGICLGQLFGDQELACDIRMRKGQMDLVPSVSSHQLFKSDFDARSKALRSINNNSTLKVHINDG
ncbi:hypothetical protein TNCV_1868491 [Trichonephila clavipes]|nr:hypothetical protein TNCV_1868491 [Trichonephila clavipes]